MARLAAHGLTMVLPAGWDGRIARRETAPVADRAVTEAAVAPLAPVIAHAATFSLPPTMGDFGGGAVEVMRHDDLFLALVEFDRDSLGSALFARQGVPPRLRPADFDPNALQRVLPGQGGTQAFFTAAERPFCLYVVLGSYLRRVGAIPLVNRVLASVQVS